MNKQQEISVIIPTHQPKEYIFDCLNSILTNKLDNVQIIIVYNGKKNIFFEKIQHFCEKNINFRLVYDECANVSNARNIGLSLSKGKYISFIDDDDWISPNYFEKLLQKAKDDIIAASNIISYNDETKEYSLDYLGKSYKEIREKSYSILRYRSFFSNVCCKLIPKTCLQNIQFDNDLKLSEDSLFMFEASKNVSKIDLTTEDVIYYRRIRKLSVSQKKENRNEELKQRFMVIKKCIQVYLKNPFKYNFLFFTSRIVAIFRHHIFNLLCNR